MPAELLELRRAYHERGLAYFAAIEFAHRLYTRNACLPLVDLDLSKQLAGRWYRRESIANLCVDACWRTNALILEARAELVQPATPEDVGW